MTRVLLVDPSARGGIASYTSRLSEALASVGAPPAVLVSRGLAQDPAGADRVLRWLPEHVWGRPQGAAAAFYARRAAHLAHASAAVVRAVREVRPDVVHLQFGFSPQADALLVRALARRVPVVWTAHDVVPFDGPADRAAAALREADVVLVHSAPAQRLLADARCPSTVVAHVPAAVPAGVDPHEPRATARRRLGLPAEGRLLAALGFVRPYKGYDLLAEVWEALGAQAPRLLVLGEAWGPEDREVLDRLTRTGRAEVRPGYAPDADLATAARAADALLLPHAQASDSGLLHLARAVGTPVLASDAPQLAASVAGTGAGTVLPRTVPAWSRAVTGVLPAPPPPPPSVSETGEAHLAAYAGAARPRLLVYSDAQAWGGAETVAADVVGSLSRSYAVTVLGVDASVVSRLAQDVPDVRQEVLEPVRGKRDLGGALAHVRALRRLRPHVVLVNLQVPWAGQYAQAAALALRLPVVAVEHAPLPTTSRFQQELKRRTAGRLAAHLSVGTAAAREVERVAGLPAGSVQVVRNGVAPATAVAADVPDGLARPMLVAAGRLDPVKGFDVLLHALADVPGASLWLLGEGEERGALTRLAEDLGVADRVRFGGWYPDPRAAFAAADVAVIPSRWESAPLVAAEALQAGAALVASDVGGLPEAVGDAAVLVPPDDAPALAAALRGLLADASEREALRARARAAAKVLPDVRQMSAGYDAVLRAVLGRAHHDS